MVPFLLVSISGRFKNFVPNPGHSKEVKNIVLITLESGFTNSNLATLQATEIKRIKYLFRLFEKFGTASANKKASSFLFAHEKTQQASSRRLSRFLQIGVMVPSASLLQAIQILTYKNALQP